MYQTSPEILNRFFRQESVLKKSVFVSDARFTIKIADKSEEITELLKLRFQVFKIETGKISGKLTGIESDKFDLSSHHLIAVENNSGRIIGGYRLRTTETHDGNLGFYSAGEFRINDLPEEILNQSVEIGRACIDPAYRNGKVLFLLWKGLAQYLVQMKKRYFFGCCSLFSNDFEDGLMAFEKLKCGGFLHENINISTNKTEFPKYESYSDNGLDEEVELPKLFQTYLRIGAKVCSQPVADQEFGTIDFFVIFDSLKMNEKYRKMFFG